MLFDPNTSNFGRIEPMDKKIAQMFIVALPYTTDEKELFETVEKYIDIGVGGLMLGLGGKLPFVETNNITDIKKLKALTDKLKSLDPNLFLAIDGEGGKIFNLFKNASVLKSQRYYGLEFENSGNTKEYEKDLDEYIKLMRKVHINMNFAPILGTAKEGYKGYLSEHDRAYSDKEETVKKLSGIAIKKMSENGIIAVGKHFPGYGGIDENPHLHLSKLEAYDKNDPFGFAIGKLGINAIMKGHVLSSIDEDMPATISEKVEKYLRKSLGFTGLVVTDAIFMHGLGHHYEKFGGDGNYTKRAVSVAKTNDIILMSYPKGANGEIDISAHEHFPRLHKAIVEEVMKGEIDKSKIDESYERIMKLKRVIM
ncbi:MAG TPA: glycoside hydrolase family 3 N-terminal domain-containing protein [Candidatus Paceibacterota bacterium]|nr:glycoside hydrolase family 3 N-terminal domain-containing protein [Candidatus Paceibacterota bacterium]